MISKHDEAATMRHADPGLAPRPEQAPRRLHDDRGSATGVHQCSVICTPDRPGRPLPAPHVWNAGHHMSRDRRRGGSGRTRV